MRERLMRKSREEGSPARRVQPTHLLGAPRLQARLSLGPAEDEYELEAERIAEQLTGKSQPSALEAHLDGLRGGGQPLPESVRSDFEPRFGHDFSRVRVHTSTQATAAAKALNAQAFTLGRDIVFAEGQLAPESEAGRRLLAHELTHVVQQSDSAMAQKIAPRTPPGREAEKVRRSPAPKGKPPTPKGADKAGQGPDLKELVRNVHDAMAKGLLGLGVGTDEQQVYANLARLNHDDTLINQLKALYKATYHVDVVEHIKSEFSNTRLYGNELDRALAYLNIKGKHEPKAEKAEASSGGNVERSGTQWVGRFLPSKAVSDLKDPFQSHVQKFLDALSTAGVSVHITTTLRPPQRSYLMYYARKVATGNLAPDKVPAFLPQGNDAPVNIDWAHRDDKGVADLVAAKRAATEMDNKYAAAQAIGKPYKSNHNGGEAIDMSFTPAWGIGKSIVDGNGKTVAVASKEDLIQVGATYSAYHWNYSGPKPKQDDPHWSKTGN